MVSRLVDTPFALVNRREMKPAGGVFRVEVDGFEKLVDRLARFSLPHELGATRAGLLLCLVRGADRAGAEREQSRQGIQSEPHLEDLAPADELFADEVCD